MAIVRTSAKLGQGRRKNYEQHNNEPLSTVEYGCRLRSCLRVQVTEEHVEDED